VAGYNGTFTVLSIGTDSFTYTAGSSGLGSGSGGVASTAAAEIVNLALVGSGSAAPVGTLAATASGAATVSTNSQTPVAITAASWSSGVASITLGSAPGYLVGQTVTIAGMTPSGYNGTFSVTSVSNDTFTYALATNPGSATAFGTADSGLAIGGDLADMDATLNSLIYTPGAGFYGTANLSVTANDEGNSGFGGALTDSRSTSITVAGLFISEIDLDKVNTTNPSQYIEVFSTVPNYTIPSGVYLVSINGAAGTPAPGLVSDIFNLSGFQTGTNGYLALLEKGEKYGANGFEVAGGNEYDNIGTAVGFGNAGSTSKFDTTTGVHTGGTRPSGQLATDILTGAVSFLLIQAPAAPTTSTNIDPGNTGNPTNQTSAYNSWNVLDSVGILNTATTSHSYAAITFEPTTAGSVLPGSSTVSTGTWVANYVGRIAQNTGTSSADWIASVVTGTASSGTFNLGVVDSTNFAGQPLNSIGGPNDWAPQESVAVNDGSSDQHSQVAELTVTFSEAVNIADLASDFQVLDAAGNALSITVTDPIDGVTTAGATGPVPDTDVTTLVISFNAGSLDTFNFGEATWTDVFGNTPTVGLNDGNYFLQSKVGDISSAANSAILLDGAHDGVAGSTTPGTTSPRGGQGLYEVDEFWRLFGDTEGRRHVDNTDLYNFEQAFGTTVSSPNYLWYVDYNEDGSINSTDQTALLARRFTNLPA
jgi:hypothetical protein